MTQLRSRNPQGFQQISQIMSSGGNPQNLLKQFVSKSTPQQMQNVLQQARNFGVPDSVLSQVQNMR